MKNLNLAGVGVLSFFIFCVGMQVRAQAQEAVSLVENDQFKKSLLELNGLVICSNDEDNRMAFAHVVELAREPHITKVDIAFSDGTSCKTYRDMQAAFLTGRIAEIGGAGGPIIAEINVRFWGTAYAILPDTKSDVAAN